MPQSLHDRIIHKLLSLKLTFSIIDSDAFLFDECKDSISTLGDSVKIEVCNQKLEFTNGLISNFGSRCYVSTYMVSKLLELEGISIDAYGSILVKDELLLNNYDADFKECNFDGENGYCNIFGFCTITKSGLVRFTQIVYSFKFKKIMVRDDVSYQLPFKPNLKYDFGGKRATYRYGSKLSIKTTVNVYNKKLGNDDSRYRQSDLRKNDLSYPRLILG